MSLPLLVTGTIGIDTIITPRGRAEGVLGGSVSFAAVAALLFTDRVDAVSIIGEDFPVHYEEALAAKGLCMDGVERKKGPSFAWTGEYFDNMNKRRTVCANDSVMLDWQVNVPDALRGHPVLVCCCMGSRPAAQVRWNSARRLVLPTHGQTAAAPAGTAGRRHLPLPYHHDERGRGQGIRRSLHRSGSRGIPAFQGSLLRRREAGRIRRHPHRPRRTADQDFSAARPTPENAGGTTGAGDTFLGALAGYLSTLPEGLPSFEHVKRGIVYGTVAASFTCESFSADALLSMTPETFRKRLAEYTEMHACRMQFMDLMFPAMKTPARAARRGC